jgi:hypothetical protein
LPFTIADGSKLKVVFLEGSALALPKNFGTSGDVPFSLFHLLRLSFIFSVSPSMAVLQGANLCGLTPLLQIIR